MLDQEKLNVKIKKRSNLFTWRGQFTPELVEYLLDEFASKSDAVADPFSGSGTVLQECARRHLNAYGFEINPAAYAMSKFFTLSNMEMSERRRILTELGDTIRDCLEEYAELPVCSHEYEDYRKAYEAFTLFADRLLARCSGKASRMLSLNILFKAEKSKKLAIIDAVRNAYVSLKQALMELSYTKAKIDAFLCDARDIHEKVPQEIDLIITSPPYINVFNYHQNYRSIMELLRFDLLKVAQSEFGSNRKNRGNRFRTVIEYCIDIESTLDSIWEALTDSGKVIMIVGRESNVRRIPFYNGQIVHDIIEQFNGFKTLTSIERAFSNKFGNTIIEDILVFKKSGKKKYEPGIGRAVARHHLERAYSTAGPEIKADIDDAMNTINSIKPSPKFDLKNGIINEQIAPSRQTVSSY